MSENGTAVLEAPQMGEVGDAFAAALAQDAQVSPPDMPAPPRRTASTDPEAPHGRDEDSGEPLAPFGVNKKTGRPNLKPGGPGRGHKQDKPRVVDAAPKNAPAAAGKATGADYSGELAGLATSVWIGASACQGGRVPLIGLKIPDLRPYACLLHDQAPQLVGAWNQAAKQSPAVRGWVEKLAGEGSWQWVIGVSVTSANFLAACTELAKKENADLRARFADRNDAELKQFLTEAVESAGIETPDLAVAA